MNKKILLPMFASVMALSMSNVVNADNIKNEEKEAAAIIDLEEYNEEQFKTATIKEGVGVKLREEGDVQKVAYSGDSFKVIATQGEWVELELNNGEAWVPTKYVDIKQSNGYITGNTVNFREKASSDSKVIDALELGDELKVLDVEKDWVKVENGDKKGYVSSLYLSEEAPVIEVEEEVASTTTNNSDRNNSTTNNNSSSSNSNSSSNTTKPETTNKPDNNANPPASSSSKVQAVLNLAYSKQGSPYSWGAEGPNSFDCSGFTYYVFKNAAGVNLPRNSSAQAGYGTTVSKSNLKPGDLVFFNTSGSGVSHVGIYVGGGNMIHSPSSGKTVSIASINSSYYSARFVTAKRVL